MRVAIIDDESDARELNRSLLTTFCQPAEVIWEADSVEAALARLEEEEPDLLLLDVRMNDGTGFDLLDKMSSYTNYSVIFMTAYEEHALRAFRYAAVDYLTKPIDVRLLTAALDRYRSQAIRKQQSAQISVLQQLEQARRGGKLIVPTDKGNYYIKFEDLIRLESENNYTWLIVKQAEKVLSSRNIGDFLGILPVETFFRVHNQHIVHRDYVSHVQRHEGGFAVMTNGDQVEIARRRKPDFQLWLAE